MRPFVTLGLTVCLLIILNRICTVGPLLLLWSLSETLNVVNGVVLIHGIISKTLFFFTTLKTFEGK